MGGSADQDRLFNAFDEMGHPFDQAQPFHVPERFVHPVSPSHALHLNFEGMAGFVQDEYLIGALDREGQ